MRKALRLEYLTVAWNIFEGLASVTIGILSGSVALVAYGLSSSLEVFTSGLVIWELKGVNKHREKLIGRLIGIAYLIVALFIFIDSTRSIVLEQRPDSSILGVLLVSASFIVMVILGLRKKALGKKMENRIFQAGARFTLVDAGLSFAVMAGLATNLIFGWWWMDFALALFLSGIAFSEGIGELLS